MALWPFGRKNPSTSLSPEVQRIFEKTRRFLDDEPAQNSALPEHYRQALAENPSCDSVPNAFGEFGRTLTNPIPVNGPVGQLVYLSRLETSDGSAIAFHRLGAFDKVDVFEVVSESGRHWDVLYLSLYFSRKSRHVPSGYRIITDKGRRGLIRGTTLHVDGFPKGIYSAALECTKRLIGIPIGDSRLKAIEARNDLVRPRKHVEALSQLEFTSQTTAPPDPRRAKPEDQGGPLSGLFRETFELLRNHIGQSADKMEARLSEKFERELTYILLYLFSTFLFIYSRDQDAGSQSDQLTKWSLTELARRDGVQIGALLQEYRHRFDHLRKIELFVSTDRVLMNEGSLQLGRYLTGQDSMLFGTIVQGLLAGVIKSLREEMTP
ncbi:MAG: hypothetical protein ACLQOQ_15180 [Beijerinckiaceae bacterium]